MKTISSPGSTSDHVETKFASDPPHVTSTFSAVAPGYIAATRERSSSLPFVCGYRSGTSSRLFSCSGSGTSSAVVIGCTPLSEMFNSTLFSQIDCHRSISNGSIRIIHSGRDQPHLEFVLRNVSEPRHFPKKISHRFKYHSGRRVHPLPL